MATTTAKAADDRSPRTEERIAKPIIKAMSHVNTWIYRISGGRFGGTWLRGAPVMLLTTVGRKSGERRTTPLLYLRDGKDVLIVGSQGGMSKNPHLGRQSRGQPGLRDRDRLGAHARCARVA